MYHRGAGMAGPFGMGEDIRMRGVLAGFWLICFGQLAAAQSVTEYHNGIDRHGAYVMPGLTKQAAGRMHMDAGFSATVPGNIYAQPLFWQKAGAATGEVIIATEADVVEAVNAATGAALWRQTLGSPVPLSALPCGNIDPEGITGTPAIAPDSGTIYLDALTNAPSVGPRHMIYAVSAETGEVLPHWPIDVQAALGAQGARFDSLTQGERSAVLLLNGNLYVSYGGRAGDCGTYYGMVVQIDVASARITGSWATRAKGGGIWSQAGIASDGTSIFATTGNTMGARDWGDGEAMIRLRPGLARSAKPADYVLPSNWKALDEDDADLGGTAAVPLSLPLGSGKRVERVLGLGKDGNAYLADAGDLGGEGGALAVVQVSNSAIITAPAVYAGQEAAMVAFGNRSGLSCAGSSITMLRVTASSVAPTWCAKVKGFGAPILTTRDGVADPIVWVAGAKGDQRLHGFDALTGAAVFSGGDAMANVRQFATILAAAGRLYVAGGSRVYAFSFCG